jgi:PAS domain S-box-containing protein
MATRKAGPARALESLAAPSPEETQQVLYELQVHQLELEMQNEELRRTQIELDDARARYLDLYDHAPVGYVTVNAAGLIREANLTAATLLGVPRGALLTQPAHRFICEDDRDTYYRRRKQLFATPAAPTPGSEPAGAEAWTEQQAFELRMVKSDGTVFWAHLEAIVTAAGQAATGARVCRITLSDVSSRVLEAQRYRAVLQTAMDGFWVADMQGHLLEVNDTYCRMSGYSAPELLAMRVSDLEATESAADTAARIQRIVAQGEDRFESWHRRKDGSVFDVEVSVQFRALNGGQLMAFLRDISARKRAEEVLRASEARLRQLTNELSRVEARERQQIAVCLHDEVGQSLALLRLKLGGLAATLDAGPAQTAIAQIRGQLEEVIDQTRTLVFELSPPILHQLGLVAALEWAGEKLQRDHSLQFVCRAEGEPGPLSGDGRTLLFRCAREVMMNTVKHARATRLTVSVERVGDGVGVTIEDDGCGFDVARVEQRRPEAGFRLFSVRERLAAAGGHCDLDSTPGGGTRVTLSIPTPPVLAAPPELRGR